MILAEFRDSITIYDEMLLERHDPFDLLNIVDKRLADVSNHVAVCHRVIAEKRCLAHTALLGRTRQKHLDRAEQAGRSLDEVIAIQAEFFEFRSRVLSLVAASLGPVT